MKNKRTNKDFNKFTKRSSQGKKSRERAKNELMRAIAETNVGTDGLKIKDRVDFGRAGASSMRLRRDEMLATGEYSSTRSGYGFVKLGEEKRDIFIPEGNSGGAIHGDVVEVIYHTYTNRFGDEKTEGRVKKIKEYGRRTVVGRVDIEYARRGRGMHAQYILIPDNRSIAQSFRISELGGAHSGDKVEGKIERREGSSTVSVIRIFGDAESRTANYAAILSEADIPVDFTREALIEAQFLASRPISEEGRVRRSEVIFTIDGSGAKDLDDAVSLRKIRGGWQLGVHIADVAAYVPERGHLDRAVTMRGTSVYFVDKVVPMLPVALSNGACSLNAGEDKYTLSAIINLTEEGEISSLKLERSIIRSRVRGVYSEVNAIFDGTADAEIKQKYKAVIPSLMRMRELYEILRARTVERGALNLEGIESQIILDGNGEPVDIIKRTRGPSECIIEEFMICANVAVAKFLYDRKIPCVYRVHEAPPQEKLMEFSLYAHNLGLDTREILKPESEAGAFSRMLESASERGIGAQVSYAMLRSMAKAKYSDECEGHFGLSLQYYCHFTSPIRRLSDLATHRIIHKVLFEGKRSEGYSKYAHRAAAAATDGELRAVAAERKIENLYKTIYMSGKVGQSFQGTVNSVGAFGFFVGLENTCEGLVPMEELPFGFAYDEKRFAISRGLTSYRIGDTVTVKVQEADVESGRVYFSLVL